MARAFIYAQARALLVSLVSRLWRHGEAHQHCRVRNGPRVSNTGRTEAVRRAMLVLIDKGEAKDVHPAYWSPFVLAGEGAR